MIKAFCDSCNREIKDMTEVGNFKIQEKVFSFIKHQKQDQLRGMEFIFCIECARKIREFFQNLNKSDGGNTKRIS